MAIGKFDFTRVAAGAKQKAHRTEVRSERRDERRAETRKERKQVKR